MKKNWYKISKIFNLISRFCTQGGGGGTAVYKMSRAACLTFYGLKLRFCYLLGCSVSKGSSRSFCGTFQSIELAEKI